MGKNLMEDFVKEELQELNIEGRKGFKYQPSTAGQENEWLNEYWKIDPVTKKGYADYSALNKCKINNLIEVPYTSVEIKQLINVDKEWKELNQDEKWEVLKKLKPKLFNQIIEEIERIDNPDLNSIKN